MTFTFTDDERGILLYALRSYTHSLQSRFESGYGDEDLFIDAYNKAVAIEQYLLEGDKNEQHN